LRSLRFNKHTPRAIPYKSPDLKSSRQAIDKRTKSHALDNSIDNDRKSIHSGPSIVQLFSGNILVRTNTNTTTFSLKLSASKFQPPHAVAERTRAVHHAGAQRTRAAPDFRPLK
jgi:hypothetical protein